jgi:aerobic-type carbon monoxide dehydrogenase small subunit (CoxS/CutS family)
MVFAVDAINRKITTVEGLGTTEHPNAVQAAFVEKDALMCGFCTPGFITSISAYLKTNPNPSLAEVREAARETSAAAVHIRARVSSLAAAKSGRLTLFEIRGMLTTTNAGTKPKES